MIPLAISTLGWFVIGIVAVIIAINGYLLWLVHGIAKQARREER